MPLAFPPFSGWMLRRERRRRWCGWSCRGRSNLTSRKVLNFRCLLMFRRRVAFRRLCGLLLVVSRKLSASRLSRGWTFYVLMSFIGLVPHRRRNSCLANHLLYRGNTHFLGSCLLDSFQSGSLVDYDFLRGAAADVPGFLSDIIDLRRFVDDGRIVDGDRGRADLYKHERRRHRHCGPEHKTTARRQRRPADVAAAHTPANPSRRPLNARHPNPGIGRVIDPVAIMVTSPRPRLIALPIPAAVGPNPRAITIGTPFNGYLSRMPAATIRTYLDPSPLRGERFVEIYCAVDLHGSGNFQICESAEDANPQVGGQPDCASVQDFFHNFLSFPRLLEA